MKIRLAKKIMAQQPYGCGGKLVIDYRIIKALHMTSIKLPF